MSEVSPWLDNAEHAQGNDKDDAFDERRKKIPKSKRPFFELIQSSMKSEGRQKEEEKKTETPKLSQYEPYNPLLYGDARGIRPGMVLGPAEVVSPSIHEVAVEDDQDEERDAGGKAPAAKKAKPPVVPLPYLQQSNRETGVAWLPPILPDTYTKGSDAAPASADSVRSAGEAAVRPAHESPAMETPSTDRFLEMLREAGVNPEDIGAAASHPEPTEQVRRPDAPAAERFIPTPPRNETPPPPPSPPQNPAFGAAGPGQPSWQPNHAVPIPPVERLTTVVPEARGGNQASHTLWALAAGLLLGSRFGKRRLRKDLKARDERIKNLEADKFKADMLERQRAAEEYNQQHWQHHLGQRIQPTGYPERQPVPAYAGTQRTSPEKPITPSPEMPEVAVAAESLIGVKQNRHIERDAWHSIVVDQHSHEDMTARARYGKEFQQEQREIHHPAASSPASGGGSVIPTAPTQTPQPPMQIPVDLPDGITQPELMSGPPTRRDPQHLLKATTKHTTLLLMNPWLWLIIGILLLVFFGASLIG
ncbi:MAG TPA: hypothetical protein VGS08_02185 [Candidatus Saccharimonadales bacterium]|nr:hypothetical protein [Candidatus Saccharimonadales bacterium]